MKRTKRLVATATAIVLALGLVACGKTENTAAEKESSNEPVVETFAAEYEVEGEALGGQPTSDTFIFEGTTEDGIITELNFDIIRNKGTEDELSRKDIMGYLMNVSDVKIEKVGDDFKLSKFTASGFDDAFEGGQYLVSASCDSITDTTTFKDLTLTDLVTQSELPMDKALAAYGYVAREVGIEELTEDTLIKDLISGYDLYKDGAFVEGEKRISFAGYNGGRSYGEQMDAIVNYILEEKMTLEEVYEMFKTVNQQSVPIEDRDAISGATISFIGDFQKMVAVAINGELPEGAVNHTDVDGGKKVEVITQGFGGEIKTYVTFDADGKIVDITVESDNETPDIGGLLTAENSDFIKALIDGQDNLDSVEAVSGASTTSAALVKAVNFAIEYYKGL